MLGDHPVPLGLSVEDLQYPRLLPEGIPGGGSSSSQRSAKEVGNGLRRKGRDLKYISYYMAVIPVIAEIKKIF